MKFIFIITIMLEVNCIALANQSSTKNIHVNAVASDTIKAEPIGGFKNFYKNWSSFASYTKEAKKRKIEGRINVKFLVNEDGTLSNFEIVKSLGYGLDEVTIESIKKCGNWNPKRIDGKAVPEVMIMPFTFKL